MSISKNTPIISEIKKFFNQKDHSEAMQGISKTLSAVRMTGKSILGKEDRCNVFYGVLTILQCLILMPVTGARNIFSMKESSLSALIEAHKDVFYRFVKDPDITWRKALWSISSQLWRKIKKNSERQGNCDCLIIDDTDFPKTGRKIENIGKVHSHTQHKSILGFKCLMMAVTDGISQLILDFALVGEKGKKGNFGLSGKELEARHSHDRKSEVYEERAAEYTTSKIELARQMIKRAIKNKIRFSHVLADSWFTCLPLIKFIKSRHVGCHWLGMIKVGESAKGQGKAKFKIKGQEYNATGIIRIAKIFDKEYGIMKRCRKLRCQYIALDATWEGVPVRIFLIRRNSHKQWNGLITTDRSLNLLQAWQLYSRRWSLEVVFKDCKQYLGLGKCQSTNFATQIADTTLCALRYNFLSVTKRFSDYETIGELFRDISKESVQLSVAQQIWGFLQQIVDAIARIFDILDEEIYEAIINESDEFAHIVELFKMKEAS